MVQTKKHKTDYSPKEQEQLKTTAQWKKEKKVPINPEDGLFLWSNPHHNQKFVYYTKDQVRDMTGTELEELKRFNREKYEIKKEQEKRAAQERRREELELRKSLIANGIAAELYLKCKPIAESLLNITAKYEPMIPCNNPSKIIVFDVETTGLDFDADEILQISIIDGDGNVLIDEYVRPYWTTEWNEAEKVNGISSATVKDAPYPHELIPKVKGIFESAELLVAYNNSFDLGMLEKWGVQVKPHQKQYDVMLEFAKVYGEWSDYFGDYTWQKLSTCAMYFNYQGSGNFHDSLEDVRATLFCYQQLLEK